MGLESVIYVARDKARMRWGEALEFTAEAGPGDFIFVPPFVPHQEINASADETLECVLVRSDGLATAVGMRPSNGGLTRVSRHNGLSFSAIFAVRLLLDTRVKPAYDAEQRRFGPWPVVDAGLRRHDGALHTFPGRPSPSVNQNP